MRRRAARAVLAVAGGSALLGLPVGVGWTLLAPRPVYQVTPAGPALDDLTSGAFVAADGWFAVLGLAAGALSAAVAAWRHRHRPGIALAGLLLGAVLGSVLAWRTGTTLAPPDVQERAAGVAVGERLAGGVQLRAPGVLLSWPLAAVAVVFSVVAALRGEEGRRLSSDARSEPSPPA